MSRLCKLTRCMKRGAVQRETDLVRTILNLIWLVLSGFWLALAYAFAGLIMCVLVITIPFGVASFRLATYVLWPFGRTVIRRQDAGVTSLLGNLLWFLLAGAWIVIGTRDARAAPLLDHRRDPARVGQLQAGHGRYRALGQGDRPYERPSGVARHDLFLRPSLSHRLPRDRTRLAHRELAYSEVETLTATPANPSPGLGERRPATV